MVSTRAQSASEASASESEGENGQSSSHRSSARARKPETSKPVPEPATRTRVSSSGTTASKGKSSSTGRTATRPPPPQSSDSEMDEDDEPASSVRLAAPPAKRGRGKKAAAPVQAPSSDAGVAESDLDTSDKETPAATASSSALAQTVTMLFQEEIAKMRAPLSAAPNAAKPGSTSSASKPPAYSTALQSGLESMPLYISFNQEGGAELSLDVAGADDVELAKDLPEHLLKRSVITADLEKHAVAPKVGGKYKKQKLDEDDDKSGPSAGPKWFDMRAPKMTDEIKRDLQLIKMRNIIDPKRFYKKDGNKKLPKVFQIGTVVEGSTDFFSARIPKKERKAHIVDELLADDQSKQYLKRRFLATHEKASSKLSFKKKPKKSAAGGFKRK